MTWNDVVTGVVLVGLSGLTLLRDNPWTSYANGFVGLWLLLAPLVFHAPTAAALNGAVVGLSLALVSVPRGTIRDDYGEWWEQYVV